MPPPGATHVALCDNIGSYLRHWCKFLDAKSQRCIEAKSVTKAARRLGSEAAKRNCYSEQEQSLLVVIPSDSEGIQPINNRHSEGNNNLIPKNFVTSNQLDLSRIAQDDKNIFSETDHASKLLGIFVSKSDVGIAMPTYFDFASKPVSTSKNLVAWLPSCLAAKKVAFTLAEVLITLGIIGVVAALTLPSIINKIKHKELETGFKKAYSTFSQGVINMKREDGEGLAEYYAYYNPDTQRNPNAGEFYKKFYQYSGVKVIGKCNYKNIIIKNYTKNAQARSYYISGSDNTLTGLQDELSNGMCSALTITALTIFIVVDTNGIKGPNLLGHDIFFFKVDKKDNFAPIKMYKLYTDEELENLGVPFVNGDPCSIKSKQAGNGTGCSYYALINQNPDDPTKGYWESLP